MKKLFILLVFLFVIYFLFQISFSYFGKGHEIYYQLYDNEYQFEIKETFVSNYEKEKDSYYFEVSVNDKVFSFQTMHNFHKSSYIIKEIKYYHDEEYSCLLPIFVNDTIIYDVMCLENNKLIYYRDLSKTNSDLDNFVDNLDSSLYHKEIWEDRLEKTDATGSITVYAKNLIRNHHLVATNYRGLYTISKTNPDILINYTMFINDIYQRNIEGYTKNYYVIANYDAIDTINKFYIVDIKENKQEVINNYYDISFNSYIQGSVDGSMYLYDLDSDTQYQIDAEKKDILEVGNKNTKIRFYENGKWKRLSVDEVRKNKPVFIYHAIDNDNFDRVDKFGHILSGYYYYYKKEGTKYKAYRSNVQNPDIMTYLFETSSIDDIIYLDDYVYYRDGNNVNYYHDSKGVKRVLNDTEYEFNKSLSFNAISN
ncbi:MAG: hypothetical protein PHP12_02480 [Bacilli bacterium]|nr:hypothetical protein [Bacilli bacterium]